MIESCAGECAKWFGFFEALHYPRNLPDLAADVIADNGTGNYREDKVNVYRGASGRIYTFVPYTGDNDDWRRWGIVSVQDLPAAPVLFEQDVGRWPLAEGELMSSDKHTGCVMVDNPRLKQRLILDLSDAFVPKRTRVSLDGAGQECKCPLPVDSSSLPKVCLPPRYQ